MSMELTTERLKLRDFREGDWPAVLAYQSDPLYLRYYEWAERTPEAVQEFVQMFIDQPREVLRTCFQLVVTLKSNRQLIGNCGIRMSAPSARQAEIGYELSPQAWGRGYTSEAGRAILEFGFNELRLHRIIAWCNADNLASVHLLEKLGMQLEGRLREQEYFKSRWWDSLLFAILEHEWRAVQIEGQYER